MRPLLASIVALGLALPAAGCAAPVAPQLALKARAAAARPAAVAVRLRVARPAYRTLGVVSAYTTADIDHVTLAIYRAGGASPVATVDQAGADLGAAVTLGNLRAGTAYEVTATAWADAAETTAISADAGCSTTFTTPAVTTAAGVKAVDDAAVALVSLALKLKDRTFAGTAAFTIAFGATFADDDALASVRVRLVGVAADGSETEKARATYALADVDAGQALSVGQLRSGSTYKLYADGLRSSDGSVASSEAASSVTFTTATITGGQADDDAGTLSLPLTR